MAIGKRIYTLICLICWPVLGWSVQLQPWIGEYFEFEQRSSLSYQAFSHVAVDSCLQDYSSDDVFFKISLGNAIKPEFSLEIEAIAAHTRRQRAAIDCVRLAGRYVWLDDLLGDCATLTTGAIFTQAFNPSLRDISSFHHGKSEAELFVSLGQERDARLTWVSRWWLVMGLGFADKGKPWWRGRFVFDYRLSCRRSAEFFIETLVGMGRRPLRLHDFHGYGPIRHESVDLGIRYVCSLPYFGSLSLEYAYRPYACNFPAHVHRVLIEVLYSFGL